jgi:hypothetical protein
MKCDEFLALLVEEWEGTLPAAAGKAFEQHRSECAACCEEARELQGLWSKLAALPAEEPPARVRTRFHAMLEGYRQGQSPREISPPTRHRFGRQLADWWAFKPLPAAALAGLLLLAGFLGGYILRTVQNGRQELFALRQEVHQMQRMVTFSLLKQESASERLRGVTWSSLISSPDPEFLSVLLETLNADPNVDVRLAAVDALSRYSGDATVRDGLIQSLRRQKSPLVQVSLIDLLVQSQIRKSADVLRELTEDTRQDPAVRERARLGLQKLT